MSLTIGRVAASAGVNLQTVRYYERRGLLPAPPRSRAGYRQYGGDTVSRLRFIKRAQELGFQLEEIKELLDLRVEHGDACTAVEAKAQAKIDTVDGKIRELRRLRAVLASLVASCAARELTADCPILETLSEDDQ
ncbi:MAG TPA: MerR family DNA-binding protein [Gemmatimonadales bacterium]